MLAHEIPKEELSNPLFYFKNFICIIEKYLKRVELLKVLELSKFTAFDFETTGLDPKNDRVIEVAAIRF